MTLPSMSRQHRADQHWRGLQHEDGDAADRARRQRLQLPKGPPAGRLAVGGTGRGQSENWNIFGRIFPEIGPTSAFYSCVLTGMHGPTGIFWANLTPFSRKSVALPAGAAPPKLTPVFGDTSPGRQSHSDTTLYVSLVIFHTKYTGWRDNDFNVYA
jgi:hypothetical protein